LFHLSERYFNRGAGVHRASLATGVKPRLLLQELMDDLIATAKELKNRKKYSNSSVKRVIASRIFSYMTLFVSQTDL
jgi:hypothetical protein